jgi:16S rRNA (cytidine1402-2'-O)-methyltransferase
MSDTSPHEPENRAGARLHARVRAELERNLTQPLAAGLYLVATPIGNLSDITLRALSVLARANVIYCEDTRHSRTLVSHYGIDTRLKPYHDHNADEQRAHVLADLDAGRAVALISDAGTPLISDPGYKLVRDATAGGHAVVSIPGASATLTALAAAGLPTDAFFFAGFLPPRSGARQSRIGQLASVPGTLIVFEAPTRVAETLKDLHAVLGDRPAAVARELTKLHEEFQRGPLSDLASKFSGVEARGEIVVIVAPPVHQEASDDEITEKLRLALASMSLRDAARTVSDALAVPKARVYDIGLSLKQEPGT